MTRGPEGQEMVLVPMALQKNCDCKDHLNVSLIYDWPPPAYDPDTGAEIKPDHVHKVEFSRSIYQLN